MMKVLLQAYAASHPGERVQMDPPLGSSGALRALLAGVLDVAVVSRPLLPEEVARGALSRAYGRTPLLVVTHPGVRKKDITTAELEQIYSGGRTTWPGCQRIRVILRPEKDIDTKLLRSLSPGMDRAVAVARRQPWAIVAVTDPETYEMVASTPCAIGTASLTSSIVAKRPLNIMSLDGVEGTSRAVAQGSYHLAKDLIFVTTARAPASALAIVDFAFSAEGRAIAEKVGVLITGSGNGAR
jgi:phosphate transport system substrate-binding protein